MGRNGNIKRALELGRLLSPDDANTTLRLGRAEVLLGLAEPGEERVAVEAALETGWDERPDQTRLYNRLAFRVKDEEDRQVLIRAEGFRRFLSDPLPEPPPDPQLEQLILDGAAKRAAATAATEAVQRQLTTALVELHKAVTRTPKADHGVLQAQVVRLREDVQTARDAETRAAGRLQQLLTLRNNRHRAFLLAEMAK